MPNARRTRYLSELPFLRTPKKFPQPDARRTPDVLRDAKIGKDYLDDGGAKETSLRDRG